MVWPRPDPVAHDDLDVRTPGGGDAGVQRDGHGDGIGQVEAFELRDRRRELRQRPLDVDREAGELRVDASQPPSRGGIDDGADA